MLEPNMASPPVHWHEGMFLRPQHFQTVQRHWADLVTLNSRWDRPYNWGLRSLELDLEALNNFRCVVRSLEARLRDGTLIVVSPEDPLPPLNLRGAMESNPSVTVFVGTPIFSLSRPNAATNPAADVRFVAGSQELEDENTGLNPQSIPVRRLNLRLLLSTQSHAGFEVIPLARLEKSGRAEAVPQLDESYIPPLLACDAWRPLSVGLVQAIQERIRNKMELLADQVSSRGITFDSHAQGDAQTIAQLRELNEAYATLGVLAFARGIHPLQMYGELCRLVGQLALFSQQRRAPELVPYDHDDLAKCFFHIRSQLGGLLDTVVEPEYRERHFVGAGLRMQAALEPAWMEPSWQMFLSVRSPLSDDDCVRLLTKPGILDMKVGSSDRVDTIYRQGAAGLRFVHVPQPPRALPAVRGQVYLQILRDAKEAEWQHVERSLTLAIRLNENLVAGAIQGQRVVTIRHDGQSVPLQFTLYLLPRNG